MNMFEDMYFDNMVAMNNSTDSSMFTPYEAYMNGNLYKRI